MRFAQGVYRATIGAEGTSEALGEVKEVDSALDGIDGRRVNAIATLTDRVSANVRSIEALLVRFGALRPTVTADFDGSTIASGVSGATAEVSALGRLRPTITGDFDGSAITRGVATAAAEATALGRLKPTVSMDFDGARAASEMVAFTGATTAATGATRGLTGSMFSLTSPLALGGIAALLVAAVAAAGPLAAGLTIVGAAGASAAAGIGALIGGILPSILQFKKYAEAQKEAEQATKAVESATDSYKSAQASLADAQRGVADAERGVVEARRQSAEETKQAEDAYQDALRGVAEAQRAVKDAERGVHDAQAQKAEQVAEAEATYRDALRGVADAQRDVREAERGVHEAQAAKAQQVADAEATYRDALRGVADAQRSVRQAEQGVHAAVAERAQQIEAAESSLEDARGQLASATRSLTASQRELNIAERDEPLNQEQATLDLASARDAASDALRDYNEAVRENGRRSEEATDAQRALQQAQLDLEFTERRVRDTRRNGSDELQGAREAARSAYEEQRQAAEGVRTAEEGVTQARRDGTKGVKDAQRQVVEAQRGVTEAQREAADAERGITEARRDGTQQVIEAQGRVADATRSLATAQREALSAQREISTAQRDGAKTVADAQRQVADAQRDVTQASREAVEAQKEIARVQAEGQRRIAEAQRGVVDAQRQARRAAQDLAAAAKDLSQAQKDAAGGAGILSAANKHLLETWKGVKQAFNNNQGFKSANDIMAGLGSTVGHLVQKSLPALGREAHESARAVRQAFTGLSKKLGRQEKNSLLHILDSASGTLKDLTTAAGQFGGGLANVFSQAVPYARRLTGWIKDMSGRFLAFTRSKEGKHAIKRFFDSAIPVAKSLAKFTGEVLSDIVNFGTKHGKDVARVIDLIADALDSWFGPKKQNKRKQQAGSSGTQLANIYAAHFGRTAKRRGEEEMPDIGRRWGKLIGRGIGGTLRHIFENDDRQSGAAGKDFGSGFLGGFQRAFRGYNLWSHVKKIFQIKKGDPIVHLWRHSAQGLMDLLVDVFTWKKNEPIGKLVTVMRKAVKNHAPDWRRFGRFIVRAIFFGFLGVDAKPATDGLSKKIKNRFKDLRPDFVKSGKNAAQGFIEGFRTGGITGGVINVLRNAHLGFKKEQGEKSPATKLWPTSGKNAALGYIKGFDSTLKNLDLRGLNRKIDVAAREHRISPQVATQARSATRRATRPDSLGGRGITAAEMRAIMHELPDRMVHGIASEVVKALESDAYNRVLDHGLGNFIDHMTNMGADAR